MTNEEAIYCMMSYLPDDRIEHCINCPYYGCNKIDEQISICKSSEAHKMAIKALEQTTWIPCSERLPEADGQYLITVKYKPEADYEYIYAEHGEWTDGKWDMFCFAHCGEVEDIIAWMPLPEPYKESEI